MLRSILYRLAAQPSLADKLPYVFYTVATNGKFAAIGLAALYAIFLALWLPFYLLSYAMGEIGIYVLGTLTFFFVGRSIIRLIAFPGASQRVVADIEEEFAKYSVRMLLSSTDVCSDWARCLAKGAPRKAQRYWNNVHYHKCRVLGMFYDVLIYLYQEAPSSWSRDPDLTQFGNNRLAGDLGNLQGLTPEARNQGRDLMDRLRHVLQLLDDAEGAAVGSTVECQAAGQALLSALNDFRDFVSSLKSDNGRNSDASSTDVDEDDVVNAMQRRFEEESMTAVLQNGLSSIIPMIDPPPHTFIFGFDVQRACMLSRYRGAKQIWVRRSQGGMIDVLHFPATTSGPQNEKAVLYCNPNAGLVEVAAGMSLIGGNVPLANETAGTAQDSWIDYYTELGIDVFVFNYAGYGRSYGTTFCVSGQNAGEEYRPGLAARLLRIFRSCFLTFTPTPDTLRADGVAVAQYVLEDLDVAKLIIHGESIGGVAASHTAKVLSQAARSQSKLSLLLCDRTFCNLEAVAQRLVGGWSGYAIRGLAPFWGTDVAGDFLAASCPKIVATDNADAIISDAASLKAGIALWKELQRGIATTKGIGWIPETPLQYRMADWENCCVTDSRYVASNNLFKPKAPVWPNDKHMTTEEVFHFAASCKRIGKTAKQLSHSSSAVDEDSEIEGVEMDDRVGAIANSERAPLILEAWKQLACCDGLTGSPLGAAVKRGFDYSVAWLCACLVYGSQRLVAKAESRGSAQSGKLSIVDADWDMRPPGYETQEADGLMHPKPIPEVISRIIYFVECGDEEIAKVLHEFQYVLGVLQYIKNRLTSAPAIEQAIKSRNLMPGSDVGYFFDLHCGHNNLFSTDEKETFHEILSRAFASSSSAGNIV